LLDLLRRGDDLQVIRFVTHRTLSDRVFINWARGAVQLRHCNDDSVITAHYPLSPAALAAVHLAIDQ
jgi:hypothetical protein